MVDQSLVELEAIIDQLRDHQGDGTELVTVTVPSGQSVRETRKRVVEEYAEAANIKSDSTRDHVQQALDRLKRMLAEYSETPENGIFACAGVVDGDLEAYCLDDLPEPIADSIYHCSDEFYTSPLEACVSPDDTFGLIVLERGRAAVGRLRGDQVITDSELESAVMGKTKAGGQSAQRFARERERQLHEFFTEVGTVANESFIDGDDAVTGVAVGGTLTTAKQFVDAGYLDYRLEERLVGTYSVEYGNEQGLHRLVEIANDVLLSEERQEAQEQLTEFFERLREGKTVTYGAGEVERATEFGAVETLLVSPKVAEDGLIEAVEQQGGNVAFVRGDSDRGERFCEHFNGLGALLRFPIS